MKGTKGSIPGPSGKVACFSKFQNSPEDVQNEQDLSLAHAKKEHSCPRELMEAGQMTQQVEHLILFQKT